MRETSWIPQLDSLTRQIHPSILLLSPSQRFQGGGGGVIPSILNTGCILQNMQLFTVTLT